MGETDLGAEGELNRFGGRRRRQGPAAGGGRVRRRCMQGPEDCRARVRRRQGQVEARYTGGGVGRDRHLEEVGAASRRRQSYGGGRARRPAEPGPGDQRKQGRTGSGRLRVLDSEQGKGLDGAAAGFGWGRPRNFGAPRARGPALR